MKVKSESEVAQSCPTLSDPMDCSLPGCSILGIFQARVLEWGAIAFSKSTVVQLKKKEKSITEAAKHCVKFKISVTSLILYIKDMLTLILKDYMKKLSKLRHLINNHYLLSSMSIFFFFSPHRKTLLESKENYQDTNEDKK